MSFAVFVVRATRRRNKMISKPQETPTAVWRPLEDEHFSIQTARIYGQLGVKRTAIGVNAVDPTRRRSRPRWRPPRLSGGQVRLERQPWELT